MGNPLAVSLTGGQVHDINEAEPLAAQIEPGALLADKGYDADSFVNSLESRGIEVVIPPKSNRKVQRECDYALYRERNRQEYELALGKAAALAAQGNSYLRDIAKSDPALAFAIESAERDNAAKSRTSEAAGDRAIRANPQDEARLKMINAPREVHPNVLRQQTEQKAAEQREKAFEEQKSKFAERARALERDNEKGR